MALAFWRDKRSTERPRSNGSRARGDGGRGAIDDPTAALRTRARRRLIGAIALLLAAVIVVPLLLDPAPRTGSDNIAIDIPSERQPFTPRLALPPVPDPGQPSGAPESASAAPTTDAAQPRAGQEAAADRKAEAAKTDASPATERTASEGRARVTEANAPRSAAAKSTAETKPETKPRPEARTRKPAVEARAAEAAHAKAGKLVLQAAALGTEPAAQDLSDRLRKAGFAPFIEKIDTQDGVRYRVRVGPYSTRDEAQRAQARLRALGVSATIIAS